MALKQIPKGKTEATHVETVDITSLSAAQVDTAINNALDNITDLTGSYEISIGSMIQVSTSDNKGTDMIVIPYIVSRKDDT